MANQTTTTADAILKDYFSEPLANILNTSHPTLEKFERAKNKFSGRRVVFPVNLRRNPGVRATAENGALPSAGYTQSVESEIRSKTIVGRLGLTAEQIASAKDDRGAFVEAVKYEMEGIVEATKDDVNRQLYGLTISGNTKSGILTQINGAATSATQTVDTTRYLKPGMRVLVGTDTTVGDLSADAVVVSSIASETSVVFTASFTSADNDLIALGESTGTAYNNEMTGLARIVSADDDDLQTVNTGDYPEWAATVHGTAGTPVALNLEDMQRLFDAIYNSCGSEPDMVIMHTSTRVEYFALLLADVRYEPLQLKGGGAAQLVFMGGDKQIPVFVDKHCTYGTIYMLNSKDIKQFVKKDWGWMDQDGAVLSRISGYNAYEAVYDTMRNLGVRRRNGCGKLVGVDYSLT